MKKANSFKRLALLPLFLLLTAANAAPAKQKEQTVTAVPFQGITKIQISPELSKISPYIRIRNLLNGRTLEVPIEGKDSIELATLNPLVSEMVEKVMLEFSLYFLEKRSRAAVLGQLFDGTQDTAPILSPRKYQPAQAFWRRVGYSMEADGANHFKIHVRPGIRTIFLSERDAQRRREAVELTSSKNGFEEAWKQLREKRYDLALNSFNLILSNPAVLNKTQLTQAYFGRGLSKFHQQGCAAAESDFVVGEKNPDNLDDISYYRGLCKVEVKDFKGALPLFIRLEESQNKTYEDPAKFYFGFCHEMLGNTDDAEAVYLDVVDFASDPAIIALAKARLDAINAQRNKSWKPSWLLFGFSTAMGYDSNVVGLPSSLSASSYDLNSEASPTILVAPLMNIFYSLKPGVIQSWRYTFAGIYYTNSDIEDSYGLMSHDLSTVFFIGANERNNHSITLGGNSITLGGFANAAEFMRIYTFDYVWTRFSGSESGKDPTLTTNYEFKTQLQFPSAAAVTASSDLEAFSYQLSLTQLYTPYKFRAKGFSLRAEYKPSKGSENSVIDAGGSLIYHRPMFGWNSAKLEQSLDLDYFMYYQSDADRADYSAKYNVAISKNIIENVLDARFAIQYHMNFSSVASSYRYNKYSANLSLSGSF